MLTELRALHTVEDENNQGRSKNFMWGIDGNKGVIANMETEGIWDPIAVKL
jgi:hypothetical protein